MRFDLSKMTIMVLSMATALVFPLSSFANTQNASKKSANTKAILTAKKLKPAKTNYKVASLGNKINAAVPTTSTTSLSDIKTPTKIESPLSGSFGTTRSTNLYDHQDGSRGDGLDYELNVAYKFSSQYSASLKTGYSQDLKDSEGNDFTDTSVSFKKSPLSMGNYILFSPSTTGIFATSKKARDMQNLQMGLRLGAGFALNPVVNPNLSLGLSLSGGQNFHDFETDVNGKVLSKYSFTQSFSAGYTIKDFSLSFLFIHKNGWSYQGNMSEAFEHAQEIGYSVNKTVSLAVGHTNSGSALKANGEDSNIALINENSSLVYGSLTLNF